MAITSITQRRRRDGTMALTGPLGVDDPARGFPAEQDFTHKFLTTWGVATIDGDVVRLDYVNARATYNITDRDGGVLHGVLRDSELFDTPPVVDTEGADA